MTTRIWNCSIIAILAMLTLTTSAHAAYVWYQIDSLNLTYLNNTTLTGDLYIQDEAPSYAAYVPIPTYDSLKIDGTTPTTNFAWGSGYLYTSGGSITFPLPPYSTPNYGEFPLQLSAYNIFLNGMPGISGTVSTEFCAVGMDGTNCTDISATPLPDTLPLFGTALLVLAGFAWWRKVSSAAR